MIFISILITFLLGWCTITAVSKDFSYLEKIGGMFLIGIGAQVLLMILLDFVGIPLGLPSIYATSLLCSGGLVGYMMTRRQHTIQTIFYPTPFQLPEHWPKINLPWLVVAGFAAHIWWWITQKSLFFPAFEFDTIAGYDLMAKVVASEGTFDNSLFYSNGRAIPETSHRLIYPPLTAGSFAYAYMSGLDLSKIMTTLFHTSGLVLVYALCKRIGLTALNAMCIILGILYIPELTAHSSLSQTNLPQAVYTSTSILALYAWFIDKENNKRYLWLSMLLLAANSMVRTENIVFGFIAGVVVFADLLLQRDKKNLIQTITYGGGALFPFIFWNIYLKVKGLRAGTAEEPTVILSYNAEKFSEWWGFAWGGNNEIVDGVARSTNYYGLTTHLFFYTLVISSAFVFFVYWRKRNTDLPAIKKMVAQHLFWVWIALFGFMLYTFFFYLVDYNWDRLRNVMMYSYKRGLFGLMILFVFFIFGNHASQKVFQLIHKFLYSEPKASRK